MRIRDYMSDSLNKSNNSSMVQKDSKTKNMTLVERMRRNTLALYENSLEAIRRASIKARRKSEIDQPINIKKILKEINSPEHLHRTFGINPHDAVAGDGSGTEDEPMEVDDINIDEVRD